MPIYKNAPTSHVTRFIAPPLTVISSATLFLSMALLPDIASGASFQILEQSPAHLGKAFAGTASDIADASSVFFNPAGIVEIKKPIVPEKPKEQEKPIAQEKPLAEEKPLQREKPLPPERFRAQEKLPVAEKPIEPPKPITPKKLK